MYLNELGYVYGDEEKTKEIVNKLPGYVVKIFEEKIDNELKIRTRMMEILRDEQINIYEYINEKQLEKYAENGVKSRNNRNSMTSEIIEKARYSNKDITRHELNLVKRHLDLLKRKNGNVTKILTKLK